MGVTIRCSLHLWTAAFSSPFYLNVVPAPVFSAALFRSYHRKIISHSDGHSVVDRQNKKADTQKHQKSAGALLTLQNDVLCNGFEIQRRDCLFIRSLADSTKKLRVQTAVFSLSIPQALGGLHRILNRNILYLVVVLFHEEFHYTKTFAENQVYSEVLYSFCKSGVYYFVTLSVGRPVIGKYMLKFF